MKSKLWRIGLCAVMATLIFSLAGCAEKVGKSQEIQDINNLIHGKSLTIDQRDNGNGMKYLLRFENESGTIHAEEYAAKESDVYTTEKGYQATDNVKIRETATETFTYEAAYDNTYVIKIALSGKNCELEVQYFSPDSISISGELPYENFSVKDLVITQDGVQDDLKYKRGADETIYHYSIPQQPEIGMTEEEALNTEWGKPKSKNVTETQYGKREQWVYSTGRYVYLDDGIVTGVQY